MEYSTTTILNKEEISYLASLYIKMQPLVMARYYNVFSVMRADIPESTSDDKWLSIKSKLNSYYPEGYNHINYFLRYQEGSFCTLHTDSPQVVTQTSITLIDRSDDIVGGDILLRKQHFTVGKGIHTPTDEEIKQGKVLPLKQPLTKEIKPLMTVPQKVGETIWYMSNIQHGVSYISKGHRLVLISWYKQNENN